MDDLKNNIDTLLRNQYFTGALAMILVVISKNTANPSSKWQRMFQDNYVRFGMYFLIAYLSTRDLNKSAALAFAAAFIVNYIATNEKFCNAHSDPIMVDQGHSLPLACESVPAFLGKFDYSTGQAVYPSDAYSNNFQQAFAVEPNQFMYAHNYASPECCTPGLDWGTSTSTGCVCPEKQQQDYIRDRGGNFSSCTN